MLHQIVLQPAALFCHYVHKTDVMQHLPIACSHTHSNNTYPLILRIHIAKSKVVFFSQIQRLTNMINKILTFSVFLQKQLPKHDHMAMKVIAKTDSTLAVKAKVQNVSVPQGTNSNDNTFISEVCTGQTGWACAC